MFYISFYVILIEIISLADHFNFQPAEESFSFPLHVKSRHTDSNYSDEDRHASISQRFIFPLTFYFLPVLYTLGLIVLFVSLLWSLRFSSPNKFLLEVSPLVF